MGGKTGPALQAYPFCMHFFVGWAKVLGPQPLLSLPSPDFCRLLWAWGLTWIFAIFEASEVQSPLSPARLHYFAGRVKVLCPHPQLCPSLPVIFGHLQGKHTCLPPLDFLLLKRWLRSSLGSDSFLVGLKNGSLISPFMIFYSIDISFP